MKYYPLFIDLASKPVVIIGGGKVAYQKILGLLQAKARIKVVSPKFCVELEQMARKGAIQLIQKAYSPGDLEGAFLAFGATNNAPINRQIHREAKEKKILFNAVDQPDECDFIVPSRVIRKDLLLAISTSGSAPFLAKHFRKKLEGFFTKEYGLLVEWMGKLRHTLSKRGLKEKLLPFFENRELELLGAIQRRDKNQARAIFEEAFGKEIALEVLSEFLA